MVNRHYLRNCETSNFTNAPPCLIDDINAGDCRWTSWRPRTRSLSGAGRLGWACGRASSATRSATGRTTSSSWSRPPPSPASRSTPTGASSPQVSSYCQEYLPVGEIQCGYLESDTSSRGKFTVRFALDRRIDCYLLLSHFHFRLSHSVVSVLDFIVFASGSAFGFIIFDIKCHQVVSSK